MSRFNIPLTFGLMLFAAATLAQDSRSSGTKYQSAKEALGVGAVFYNAKNYASAREPLEAAVKLSGDDKRTKIQAFKALASVYRQLGQFKRLQSTSEFIIENSDSAADRSMMRRAYLAFAQRQGKLRDLTERYEARLRRKPNDYLSVYLLSEIYSRAIEKPDRAIELMKSLETIEKVRFESKASGTKNSASMPGRESIKLAREKSKLARQYLKSRQAEKAARLYEEIAPLDSSTQAWHLKEAASAWLMAQRPKEALRLAQMADKVEPEARNDQLAHFFHRKIGDVYLDVGRPQDAIRHYEIAIAKTNIDGYIKGSKESLAEAREKLPVR